MLHILVQVRLIEKLNPKNPWRQSLSHYAYRDILTPGQPSVEICVLCNPVHYGGGRHLELASNVTPTALWLTIYFRYLLEIITKAHIGFPFSLSSVEQKARRPSQLLPRTSKHFTMYHNNIHVWRQMSPWLFSSLSPFPEDVIKVKMSLTGSLAFCAKTAKVDSLLHRHLVWETAGDGSVWQLSASQFSSPVSLLIGYSDDTQTRTKGEKMN